MPNSLIILLLALATHCTLLTASSFAQTSSSLTPTPSATRSDEFNTLENSQLNEQSGSFLPFTVGIAGSLILLFFGYKKPEKRQRKPVRIHQKVDRYQEEFILDSPRNQSQKQKSATTPKSANTVKPAPSDANGKLPIVNLHYNTLINRIVNEILQKQVRLPDFIYQELVKEINPNNSEVFETCLIEQINTTQSQLAQVKNTQQLFVKENPEIEKARLNRQIKALQSIQTAWERWLKDRHSQATIAAAAKQIRLAAPNERLSTLIQVLDPNQTNTLTLAELQQVAKLLQKEIEVDELISQPLEVEQIARGIAQGIKSYEQLEDYLVTWLYEPTANQTESINNILGYGLKLKQRDPWAFWSRRVDSQILQQLFEVLAEDNSITTFALAISASELSIWTELLVTLQFLQRGMVNWFEKQPYDSQWGTASSIATFLTWACIWCQFSQGLQQTQNLADRTRELLIKSCLQVTLQILRVFSHKSYFPLYGGVFALFSRDALQDALKYLDEPLLHVEGTQEKARFLTLLGYSQQFIGETDAAIAFHQQALDLAQNAGDRPCEIANFNHLSRICVTQKNYSEAINYSQRALVLARQVGDRLGEANALANLGYSEVKEAQQLERLNSDSHERAIANLKRGSLLAQNLGEIQCQAICCNSLGLAYLIMQQPHTAVSYLIEGSKVAQGSGDLYLQGLNFNYLAEAYYALNQLEQAAYYGFLAMYLLNQISAKEWQQPANLLVVIQGKVEISFFQELLRKHQSVIVAIIGVDGYDYLLQLWEKYKQSSI
jgi:tetratricopeptide (TPR) repeat protein